jgi:5-hydroxyisourate hydrolase-like protein (transthyretin family)
LIGKNVTFHLSGGALEKEMSRLTNAFGNATILEYLLMSGTYNISARFEGNADYYGSNANWAFIVNALNTSISLPSLINATQQKPVILSATLKDENNLPIKQVSVTFYIYNGTGWEEIGSSQTNDAGVANLEYSPLDAGTYQLLAVFEGNGMYLGSNATSTLKVNAKPSDINYILYVVAGVFILFAVIVFIKISRRRR